ncbi:MAG: DUF6962 family protein [Longimicrobiales bacterium]
MILHPTTSLTNLLLSAECWVFYHRLRSGSASVRLPGSRAERIRPGPDVPHPWSGFFLFLGLATLFGAAKHGLPHYLAGSPLALTIFASSLAGGVSTLHAEVATIRARVGPSRLRGWLERGAYGKLALFTVALLMSRSFLVVVADTALGLLPVMLAEGLAFRRGDRGAGWVAGGLALSCATALIYLLEITLHPWFNHNDFAHVLMMASLLMIYRGVRPGLPPPPPTGGDPGPLGSS